MEDIKVVSKCDEDSNISRLRRKVSRNLWDEFKTGYLSMDLNLTN